MAHNFIFQFEKLRLVLGFSLYINGKHSLDFDMNLFFSVVHSVNFLQWNYLLLHLLYCSGAQFYEQPIGVLQEDQALQVINMSSSKLNQAVANCSICCTIDTTSTRLRHNHSSGWDWLVSVVCIKKRANTKCSMWSTYILPLYYPSCDWVFCIYFELLVRCSMLWATNWSW